ncbi:endonuclease/exonuclease/phosphatase family protein [Flammeovirga aprica]|uniref:Endonuclease/exonuclease/phosphatase family protein n=1 Tax=Flammeovirga aprica JL-4 TaxID=694437 RepID=A0A7X9P240_9BACT|nr:endonuclease/exonuclease/phosphatase family protein [Flammeovirga aprica]NME68136.1 endonuclease/exonuclease/phosphatase family protein [Flammeovirga aprica JL-4]
MIFFFKRNKFRIFGVLCVVFSQLGTLPESMFPSAILWALITPFLGLCFIPLLIEELIVRKKYFLHFTTFYILFLLILTVKTFQYSVPSDEKSDFSIMSYNVSVFNIYGYLNHNYKESKEMIEWLKKNNSDIYCFQEYYHLTPTSKKHNPDGIFNTNYQLGTSKGLHVYAPAFLTNHIDATFGLATISRFPIINKEKIDFKDIGGSVTNGVLITDLKVSAKDTVKVINCHLQSIILDNGETKYKSRWDRWSSTILKIYKGALLRQKQIEIIMDLIKKSPFPVVLCGDFNEPPYGYGYFSFDSLLKNSFENKGNGFGFTLRDLPFRIDQIFYSSQLKLHAFTTDSSIKASDHYPVISYFSVK